MSLSGSGRVMFPVYWRTWTTRPRERAIPGATPGTSQQLLSHILPSQPRSLTSLYSCGFAFGGRCAGGLGYPFMFGGSEGAPSKTGGLAGYACWPGPGGPGGPGGYVRCCGGMGGYPGAPGGMRGYDGAPSGGMGCVYGLYGGGPWRCICPGPPGAGGGPPLMWWPSARRPKISSNAALRDTGAAARAGCCCCCCCGGARRPEKGAIARDCSR